MLHKDFKEFLQLLNAEKVEYLLVGGYAVGIYGYPRYTGDMDIWLKPSLENALKALSVISAFGFSSLNITESDLEKPGAVIQLGFSPVRIDIITELDGVEFEECYSKKGKSNFDEIEFDIIGLEDLIKNKKATGRHKDLDDVEHLEKK